MAQVFVVVAAGSVIAFIARDFPGDASLSGWVIQVSSKLFAGPTDSI